MLNNPRKFYKTLENSMKFGKLTKNFEMLRNKKMVFQTLMSFRSAAGKSVNFFNPFTSYFLTPDMSEFKY